MQEFEVGSYVWFVRSDKPGVRHYLVVEEIVKRSIDGITRDYLFETESAGKIGRVESKSLIGDYFVNRNDAYDFMLKQAGEAINRMMDKSSYANSQPEVVKTSTEVSPQVTESSEQEEMIIEMPDGTKARLKGGIPK